jgi:thiamine pyrophosphate-dependent acetolactate synthase large subunit-like protein
MTTGDALALALTAEGVNVLFAVPDDTTISLVHTLSEHGIRVVRPRHEQSAVLMADGYSRVSSGIGVCAIGAGPGFAQTGTALMTAFRRRSPVLVLLGRRVDDRSDVKLLDARRVAEALGARFVTLNGGARLADDVREAFRLVRLNAGPVVALLPYVAEIDGPVATGWQYLPARDELKHALAVDPSSDVTDEAAGMLAWAKRPVILAGRGAIAGDARHAIEALADRIGALLVTSVQARELFRSHPRYAGPVGTFAAEGTTPILAEADCVLAVGIALNRHQTGGGPVVADARVIHVDRRAEAVGQYGNVDLGIVGDVRSVVSAIDRALAEADVQPAVHWQNPDMVARIQAARARVEPTPVPASGPLPGTAFLDALDGLLPEDRLVVADGGKALVFAFDAITVSDPSCWVWTIDFGSIGLGLSMGIGAALARPDRHCIVFVGDGGLMMSLQELETAVRERVPLTVVVMNDGAYAAEVDVLARTDKPGDLALYGDVDFAAVASALGGDSMTIRTLEDLDGLRDRVVARTGLFLVDAKVSEHERHRASG